jgi:hypothetical protein
VLGGEAESSKTNEKRWLARCEFLQHENVIKQAGVLNLSDLMEEKYKWSDKDGELAMGKVVVMKEMIYL